MSGEPQRFRVYDDDEVLPVENGEYVTYADAKAWVEREVKEAEEFIRKHDGCADAEREEGYEQGQRDALAKAVQAVEALFMDPADGRAPRWGIADVIAAIKGDSDE